MTSWHLADLENSLVPDCEQQHEHTVPKAVGRTAFAGSREDLCNTECPYSGTAVTASASAERRSMSRLGKRAHTAWTRTHATLPLLIPTHRVRRLLSL